MRYRKFGKTGYLMPILSLGGMRFQTSWKREDLPSSENLANLERIVGYALQHGVNHLETARGYGTSEAELGEVLSHFPRENFLLQTKIGPRSTWGEFEKDFYDSLKTLKTEYLDLFAVHGINNAEILQNCLRMNLFESLLKLKDRGIIRALGFSTHAPIQTIIDTIQTGMFDYVNLWYSYIYQFNWPAIEVAHRHNLGVFIISPTDKGGMLYQPSTKFQKLCDPWHPIIFNDTFIWSHTEIHTISCGAKQPSDLDLHLEACNQLEQNLSILPTILHRLNSAYQETLGKEWVEHYLDGIPEWDQIPHQINIRVILWLWNLVQAYDMVDFAKMRYNLLGNGGTWFPGNPISSLEILSHSELTTSLQNSPFAEKIKQVLMQAHQLLSGTPVHRLGKSH